MLESAIFAKRRSALFKRKGIDGIIAQAVLVLCLVIVLLLTMLPLLVTLVMSVKTPQDITQYPMWTFPKSGWMFSNYANAFNVLIKPMLNTVIIDLISTVVTLFLSCFVAYLFEKKKFPGRKFLFLVFIAPMLVPSVVVLSPTYIVVAQWLQLKDNWLGLILPYIAGNQIASVFLLRTFMSQQPDSLYEAAKLDGASTFRVFMHICLPLSVPIMMVQGINIFAAIYNDYLWPQLLFQADLTKGVLMPYLRSVVASFTQGVQYAMYLVAGIPLIITTIISIKFFVNGDFASGMKL
ncbi:MAG: carbohydrate ABC transporter permease [Clostridia bacterium]|jgi:multiple sugar transport system permease protein|nr:carbohydrate ABC transporter permease [Clostridia bacterium]